ncbi:hypothetical protein Tco_0311762 [Tanacetum coccineum]
MLEDIRTYVMLRNFKKAEKAEKLEHEVCPSIRKRLEYIKVEQRHWSVIPSDYNVFEARNEYNAFVVDIRARTCSCRSWQLSGIPYVHTVAALAFLNKDPKTYVCEWLKKDMFKEAYKYHIRPLKDSSFWPKTDDIEPLPPKERRMPGRPCVNRKRGACEKDRKNANVGFGRKMTCRKCYEKGHNSRSCKKQKTDPPLKDVRPKGRSKRVVAPTSERASTKWDWRTLEVVLYPDTPPNRVVSIGALVERFSIRVSKRKLFIDHYSLVLFIDHYSRYCSLDNIDRVLFIEGYYSSAEKKLFFELRFVALDGSDQDARYALSKLLQRGTVAEYESEF